jgi:hypothetical protein
MSYEEDLAIDSDNLDLEWQKQPQLYQKYSEMLAKAEQEKADIREELDVLKAKVDLDIRQGNRDLGAKLTEGTIASGVVSDQEVIAKTKELNESTYRVNVLKGVVESFANKKKGLEKLVDLFIFGYNAEPKTGRIDNIREQKRRRDQGDED